MIKILIFGKFDEKSATKHQYLAYQTTKTKRARVTLIHRAQNESDADNMRKVDCVITISMVEQSDIIQRI